MKFKTVLSALFLQQTLVLFMVGKMNKNKSTSEIVLAEQVAGMIEELKLLGAYDKFISASEVSIATFFKKTN